MRTPLRFLASAGLALAAASATVAAQDNGGGPLLSEGDCESLFWKIWKMEQMSVDVGFCRFDVQCWKFKAELRAAIDEARSLYDRAGCDSYRPAPPPPKEEFPYLGTDSSDTSALDLSMTSEAAVSTP